MDPGLKLPLPTRPGGAPQPTGPTCALRVTGATISWFDACDWPREGVRLGFLFLFSFVVVLCFSGVLSDWANFHKKTVHSHTGPLLGTSIS